MWCKLNQIYRACHTYNYKLPLHKNTCTQMHTTQTHIHIHPYVHGTLIKINIIGNQLIYALQKGRYDLYYGEAIIYFIMPKFTADPQQEDGVKT